MRPSPIIYMHTWEDVYLQSDVNTAYSSFLTKFLMYFLHIFPQKQVLNKKRKKFILDYPKDQTFHSEAPITTFVKKKDVSVCFYSKLYIKNLSAYIGKSYPLLRKEKMTESSQGLRTVLRHYGK
jgi:adenine specific DNA methylase Mod